ncbi:MAG: YlbF family regulator [Firmicutes bacterium]|nr:YlbF family regulator [Bacillota bacterium]
MDIIEKARELGRAIQSDERYVAYAKAKLENDADEQLQAKIGEFNLIRMQLSEEMNKVDDGDKEKLQKLNADMRACYAEIMSNDNMKAFNLAKSELDSMVSRVTSIIELCIAGEDPDTCEPSSCTGSCSTCGGCH